MLADPTRQSLSLVFLVLVPPPPRSSLHQRRHKGPSGCRQGLPGCGSRASTGEAFPATNVDTRALAAAGEVFPIADLVPLQAALHPVVLRDQAVPRDDPHQQEAPQGRGGQCAGPELGLCLRGHRVAVEGGATGLLERRHRSERGERCRLDTRREDAEGIGRGREKENKNEKLPFITSGR